MKIYLVVAVLALALIASPVMAKEGFYLGAYIPFNHISGDINTLDNGAGLGARAGIGFNKYLSLEGSFFKTEHDMDGGGTADFRGATVDLKLNLPLTGSKMEPYALIGIGGYRLEGSGIDYKGGGGQFGVGLDMYVYPELSLNAGLTWRKITFDSGTPGNVDIDADVRTFDIGITYHFL